MQKIQSGADWDAVVAGADNFMFDMDGVLFGGNTVFDGVPEALTRLQQQGKKLVFVTNNSTKSRAAYESKFAKLGIRGIRASDIFGSAYAVVCYLDSIGFDKQNHLVFVVGEGGLATELHDAGYQTAPDVTGAFTSVEELCDYPLDSKVRAVVCGFDGAMCYRRMAIAHAYLKNPDVLFVATNMDTTYPGPGGRTFPGSGAITTLLATSTGRDPVVVGKPEQIMLNLIYQRFGFDPARTCMVGDRLDTDIAFGKTGGCQTLLVLSGCTVESTLLASSPASHPDYYAQGLGEYGRK